MSETGLKKVKVISENISDQLSKIKQQDGKDIIIFGSPSVSNTLLKLGLVDEFWLFVNPVILGKGIPLFQNVDKIIDLKLIETKIFQCGVIALHYIKI